MVTISVDADESGLTITADASAIGGGMVTLTEAMMPADDMAANGMTTNGGTGMTANGGNGMTANGGNGMTANGGMADSAMVYSYSAHGHG